MTAGWVGRSWRPELIPGPSYHRVLNAQLLLRSTTRSLNEVALDAKELSTHRVRRVMVFTAGVKTKPAITSVRPDHELAVSPTALVESSTLQTMDHELAAAGRDLFRT